MSNDGEKPNAYDKSGYVSVNGLDMYYEIHGEGQPLVLLHGAFSGIGTSFGKMLPGLAQRRQFVAFELQTAGARSHRRHRSPVDRRRHGR
jgi:pimeloyl-ACP methyl ester carboxylesterase